MYVIHRKCELNVTSLTPSLAVSRVGTGTSSPWLATVTTEAVREHQSQRFLKSNFTNWRRTMGTTRLMSHVAVKSVAQTAMVPATHMYRSVSGISRRLRARNGTDIFGIEPT